MSDVIPTNSRSSYAMRGRSLRGVEPPGVKSAGASHPSTRRRRRRRRRRRQPEVEPAFALPGGRFPPTASPPVELRRRRRRRKALERRGGGGRTSYVEAGRPYVILRACDARRRCQPAESIAAIEYANVQIGAHRATPSRRRYRRNNDDDYCYVVESSSTAGPPKQEKSGRGRIRRRRAGEIARIE
jgi:hypothetical protein